MNANRSQRGLAVFARLGRLLVKRNERRECASSLAHHVVPCIYPGDVGIEAIDAGKDVKIAAGLLEAVEKISPEETAANKAVIGNSQQGLAFALSGSGDVECGKDAVLPYESNIVIVVTHHGQRVVHSVGAGEA